MSIDDLLQRRRLERVPADASAARERLEVCRRHLDSARALAALDPEGADVLAYDAARKAVAAHMLAAGLRARNAPGAHEATARYAEEALDPPSAGELDRMRRFRNRIEYGTTALGAAQVEHDVAHAERIVEAVAEVLGRA